MEDQHTPLANCGVCKRRPVDEGGYDNCPFGKVIRADRALLAEHDCTAFAFGSRPERYEAPAQEEALF